MTVLKGVEV